jgi:predicted O-methyltransferase YrrM
VSSGDLRQILGYLRRPRLYPELVRIARWRLLGPHPDSAGRERSERWCEERAVGSAEAVARLTGAPMPAPLRALYPEVFAEADRRAAACPTPMGGPGDLDLLYGLAEHLQARAVVETGVAYGWSSLALLLSLSRREGARLVSTDMPYVARDNEAYVGCVVPRALRGPWQLIRLADGEALPRALRLLPRIDLCHYDSSKRYAARRWAYPLLWRALRPGGCLVSDDIGDNLAFHDFCREIGAEPVVVRHSAPPGSPGRWYVGVLRKPAGS